jgi:SAM-dependent methyltransferase
MNIDSSSYQDLVNYYDILNQDKTTYRSTNDEPTPIGCIEEMMQKIPNEIWTRQNLRILDPCCGNGNFFIVIFKYLLEKSNYTKPQILKDVLHFNDINPDRLSNVEHIFNHKSYKLNITEKDFLTFPDTEKYDLIVANPPYAKLMIDGKRASKNHTMVRAFLSKALQQLKPDGYLLFITPNNWMSFADRNDIPKKFTSLQIIYLNIHGAKKWFPKIGSSFTWYIVQNKKCSQATEVDCIWKKQLYQEQVLFRPQNFIPLFLTSTIDKILYKTILDLQRQRFKIQTNSHLHRSTKKHLLMNSNTENYPYRIIHTPKQTLYSSVAHIYQNGYKVFISTTDKYKVFIDKDVGMTQSIAFILCQDEQEAITFLKILQHPLYVFLNNICRWGNFNNIRLLQSFPIPNNTNDIYSDFQLTEQEILYIQDKT